MRSSGTCPGRSSGTCPGRSSGTCPGRSSGTLSGISLFDSTGCSTHRPRNQLRGVAACRSGASARAAPDRWRPLKVPENRTVRPLSLLESMLFPARQRPGAPGRKLLANSAQAFPVRRPEKAARPGRRRQARPPVAPAPAAPLQAGPHRRPVAGGAPTAHRPGCEQQADPTLRPNSARRPQTGPAYPGDATGSVNPRGFGALSR